MVGQGERRNPTGLEFELLEGSSFLRLSEPTRHSFRYHSNNKRKKATLVSSCENRHIRHKLGDAEHLYQLILLNSAA